MIFGRRIMMLLAALAARMMAVQAPNPPPPTESRVALSIREAPETLVYQIFFREFVASQRAAGQLRDMGEDDTGLRNFFQRAFGLDAFEHQMLNSAAQTCVTAQENNLRTIEELARQLKLTPDDTTLRARIGRLRADSQAAVAQGVQQLRSSLPPPRFARLDLMIRVRIVPNLRISPPSAGVKKSSGGN